VASDGAKLLVADYNQIELRCIAHLADDPGLIEAFTAGVDVHTATAARVFGVKPNAVTSEQRSRAKMVAYGLAYGMEAYGLSQRLAIPVDEAAGILDSFFGAFPAIKSYMERTVADAKKMKYTETLFGRRRPIPELSSDNFRIRQAGERMAMNAAIQGLAADIFKIALVRIDDALTKQNLQARIVLQVHDEVLVEAPVNERETVENIVLDIMRSAAELRVPLEVNAAWGATWAEAK
jgi:DNA polymerase-1